MKTAISSIGRGLDSSIDVKFERCHFFLILDIEKNTLLPIENKTKDRPHEIGGTVGQLIANQGIDSVITTDIGPRAFEMFKRYGIKIYQAKGIVEDAIRLLKEEKLVELTKPTVPEYSEWKKKNMEKKDDRKCPYCGHIFPFDFRICPHCGKK
jgi:predicted Fe-Mo cluster-binding NifX family protein